MWLLICLNSCKSFVTWEKDFRTLQGWALLLTTHIGFHGTLPNTDTALKGQFMCVTTCSVSVQAPDREILTLWQSLFNSQNKQFFLTLSKAAKSALGILVTGRQQGDQGLCIHLQWSHEGHICKEVASWKTQTDLHLSSLVAAHKGQGCDASDSKAQELRKGMWQEFSSEHYLWPKTLSSLLWKITWLLKSPLALQSEIQREVFAQYWWQLS